MINKLKSKIFWLIMITLSIITLGVVILFTIINYRNTINTSSFFIDRVYGIEDNRKDRPLKPEEDDEERMDRRDVPDIDGFYSLIVKDDEVIGNNGTLVTEEIKNYAIKASNKKSNDGIIGNYIYRIDKEKDDRVLVILVQNEDAVTHIKILYLAAIGISVVAIGVIYIIAKKVSELIVKPVENTFEKQIEFISDASHELKTPLAVIEANADVLENEVGKNKWIDYIQNEIESMDKLVNELLLLAKIENVDNIQKYEEFDLSKEVEICIAIFESMAYEKNVKVNTNIEENVKINGNKEDIKHILSTLIDNAIKHTESEKSIEINLKKNKENIIIEVKNEGEPIPKEEREKIFERFYRVDKSRNREAKRYGLGLAIAKSTVEKYKGSIEVECNNGYTIFKVQIPIKNK